MPQFFEGNLDAKGLKFGIVVARFNSFISERGKITPRRISGVCAPHQRRLAEAIKQARNIALLPFASRAV